MKGKSVETKFEKSSVIRQSNAFKSQRQSILGKPATFSDSLAKTNFSKSKSVTTQNVSRDFSKPVTAQILPQNVLPIFKNTNMIAPGMYKVNTKPNQTRTPRLPQDIRKTNKRVSFSTGVIPTTSISIPQLKSNQLEDRLVEIILFIVDSGCSKHMTRNLKLLTNFMEKFLGTVKFGNDQIAPILGYGDLIWKLLFRKHQQLPIQFGLMQKATSSQHRLWHHIETLTLEQYLALDLNNTRRRFTCPDNSTFEVKGQLLRELRNISFLGVPTDSVVEHISNVLEIACIFNAQESTLIQVFPNSGRNRKEMVQKNIDRMNKKLDKINYDETYTEPSNRPTNLKDKFEQCLKESGERQEIQNEWMKKIMISTDLSLKNHDSSIKMLEQKENHLAQLISTPKPKHTLTPKTETFGEKVKRRILEENKEPTINHDKPKQQLQKVVSHEIKELPAHHSATLQNKLPPKETDPGSFILP
ncbi:hypothetical protein Tco_0509607 [Tanacetum coccineum]